jgi:oligosaccharyltransferase complex subunit gamma
LSCSGFSAEAIADALRKAGVPITFKRPVDKTKVLLGGLSTLFSLFGAYIIYRYAAAILNPKFLWAIVTGVSCSSTFPPFAALATGAPPRASRAVLRSGADRRFASTMQGIIITMTSGYMWNKIRHPPYTSRMQNGMVGYIAGGYQNQVGAETHIISAVCKRGALLLDWLPFPLANN